MSLGCCISVSTHECHMSYWFRTQLAKTKLEVTASLPRSQASRSDGEGKIYKRHFEVRFETTWLNE
jgi:hypothetical protein